MGIALFIQMFVFPGDALGSTGVGENGIVSVGSEANLPFLGVFVEVDPRSTSNEESPKFVKRQCVRPERASGAVRCEGDGVHGRKG